MIENEKKCIAIALIAFVLGLAAYSLASSLDQDIAFEVIINNTNLAPTVPGETPGTGERVSGTTYWTNNSAIELFVFAHAASAGQNSEIHLNINGTKIADTSGRPVGAAEQSNKTIVAIIPKGVNYSVEFTNTHHYEWREYPILSGKNGTVSINQTFITTGGGGGVSFDGSDVNGNGSLLWNISINHKNLTNLNGSNTGHAEFDNLTLNKSIVSAFRMNITRDGRNPGTNEMLGSLDMMSVSGNNFLFYTVERWYDTQKGASGGFEYGSHPERTGSLIQTAGQQILLRSFGSGSLSPVNKFEVNLNQTKMYCNSTNSGRFRVLIDTDNTIYIWDCQGAAASNIIAEFYTNGTVQLDSLAGSPSCRLWSDVTGKIYRNSSDCG